MLRRTTTSIAATAGALFTAVGALAAEKGHKFPPLQSETYASQLFWLVLIFVALYLLMSRIALPRVGAILDARSSRIEDDIAAAKRLKDSSDEALAAYEKSLADARSRAQTLASEVRARQAAAAEAERKALDVRLNAKISEAEKSIAATREAAMANVRSIATEAAGAIVERLTGVAPPPGDVAAAVGNAVKR
jgi:F-type H+-transporting ATPase subunit b